MERWLFVVVGAKPACSDARGCRNGQPVASQTIAKCDRSIQSNLSLVSILINEGERMTSDD
jgi:hypothetical protein